MEAVYQHANESKLNYKVLKGQPLHQVWNALWQQCEDANESQKTCIPRAKKNVANIMKMLEVFQSEVKERSSGSNSEIKTSKKDVCENCEFIKSKQMPPEENYGRIGEATENLLPQSTAPLGINEGLKNHANQFYLHNENVGAAKPKGTKYSPAIAETQRPEVAERPPTQPSSLATKGPNKGLVSQSFLNKEDEKEENPFGTNMNDFKPNLANTGNLSGYGLERDTPSKENTTKTLLKFLPNLTKYDPMKDPFTNMSVFENECSQLNLGPRESCLMMKLWLPSHMSARLSAPVACPAGGSQFWSKEYHWGERLDRVKALTYLATGEDHLGTDFLENLKVTPEDDPWEFARKFEQAYRLVMDFHDPKPSPALLKTLVNKFSYVDRITNVTASKEKTIDGIVRLVNSYHRDNGLTAVPLWRKEVKPTREVLMRNSIPKDEQPMRWRQQTHNCQCFCSGVHGDTEGKYTDSANPLNEHENSTATVASSHNAPMQSQKIG